MEQRRGKGNFNAIIFSGARGEGRKGGGGSLLQGEKKEKGGKSEHTGSLEEIKGKREGAGGGLSFFSRREEEKIPFNLAGVRKGGEEVPYSILSILGGGGKKGVLLLKGALFFFTPASEGRKKQRGSGVS